MYTHEIGKLRVSIKIAGADLCEVLISMVSHTKDAHSILTTVGENEDQLTK